MHHLRSKTGCRNPFELLAPLCPREGALITLVILDLFRDQSQIKGIVSLQRVDLLDERHCPNWPPPASQPVYLTGGTTVRMLHV